ncbi:MAG: hypothetical protein R3B40_02020 [Polyangiales bacterium]|nr:hypothetical protein [Myxococcales bacterium]MCB9658780.1 hypothetical protein [Sandaracinaceae bacterium]
MTDPKRSLDAIFDADRAMRQAEAQLLASGKQGLIRTLVSAVAEAKELGARNPAEAGMRLERLADLCAQVPGPEMTDALIDIMDYDEPPVRIAAGEALLDVAYEYYAEVARGIERALDAGRRGLAMCELPHVLAEVGEPSAMSLMKRFLDTDEPEIIAATIEAFVTLDDPDAVPLIERFSDDERTVAFDEADDETGATLGELAQEAAAALGGDEFEDDD